MHRRADAFGRTLNEVREKDAAVFQITAAHAAQRTGRKRTGKIINISAEFCGVGIKRIINVFFETQSGLAECGDDWLCKLHGDHPFWVDAVIIAFWKEEHKARFSAEDEDEEQGA